MGKVRPINEKKYDISKHRFLELYHFCMQYNEWKDELTQRGSTLLKGVGSYSKEEKQVVMCACSSKQMHMVQKAVKEVDRAAFLVTMESNEVRGEGFKPH